MEIKGTVKLVEETQVVGTNGFRKRLCVITTSEQYPQTIATEFVQDKVDLLDKVDEGDEVTISINIRGREWTNPEGEVKYFTTVQGWRIQSESDAKPQKTKASKEETGEPDDLPF